MKYKIIFDITSQRPHLLPIFIVLLSFGVLIGFYFYYKSLLKKDDAKPKAVFGLIFIFFCFLFLCFWSFNVIPNIFSDYNNLQNTYKNKQYKIVEGQIENYHPMPESGHDSESFTVNGVKFSYSDYDLSNHGYNNAASHGGAIRKNGQNVRISYANEDGKNIILKLETK